MANAIRAHRAPALEELYNFGPHVGNIAFEIGNPDLQNESSLGLEVSLRSRLGPVRGELNVFRYGIDDFVFPSFTGEVEDGLRVAEFLQGDSRFVGFDAKGSFRLHPSLWLHLGAGYVDAQLADTGEPLPRIPPFHGRVELEIPYRRFTVKPELVWALAQNDVFRSEIPTDGYSVLNLNASYVLARGHVMHLFTVTAYNLTDEEYRLHTSFIKDLAPEMGRGVRVAYSLRFF